MPRGSLAALLLVALVAWGCSGGSGGGQDVSDQDAALFPGPTDLGAEFPWPDDAASMETGPADRLGPDVSDLGPSMPDALAETPESDAMDAVPEQEAEAPCVPDCVGKQCGPDGCGGDCGVCPPPENLCGGYLLCVFETGECQWDPESVVTCPDNPDPCLDDVCDPSTGTCEPLPAQDGLPCDDGDPKTSGDQCLAGLCSGGKPPGFCDQYTDNFDSIKEFPPDHTLVDFEALEKCDECACCAAGQEYPWTDGGVLACMQCEMDLYLSQWGITKVGGMTSTMVFCITGNEDAPMSNEVLFVGADLMPAPGVYAVQFNLGQGVLAFGLSSVPSASNSDPLVTLRGFDAAGNQVGYDQFSYVGNPPSGCEGTNPVVSFFGFRACGGAPMVKIVAEYTSPNVTIDNLVFYPPLE